MIDYKEIFQAWLTGMNPTDAERELAKNRIKVCLDCEYKKEILKGIKWSAVCEKCGCPLSKKVFSKNFNACPLKKWEIIDLNFLQPIVDKNNKTII